MAVNLSPVFGVAGQLFDNNGNPLAGGKIFTYLAGTTTPAATYTSSSGAIAHSNPIVLDGAGRVPSGEIWLTDGIQYKFVVEDAVSNLIGTYDNLTGINSNFVAFTNEQEIQTATAGQTVFNLTTMQYQPGTNSLSVFVDGVNQYGPGAQYAYVETDSDTVTFVSGLHVGASVKFTTSQLNSSGAVDAGQVSYDPPFPNSVITNVEDKLAQTVSVTDFGAVGDNSTDNIAAFSAAINSGAKRIYIPAGQYFFASNPIFNNLQNITFYGDSAESSILTWNDGRFAIKSPDNVTFQSVGFSPNASDTLYPEIFVSNALNTTFDSCIFRNFGAAAGQNKTGSTCLWIYAGDTTSATVAAGNTEGTIITNCRFFGSSRKTNFGVRVYTEFGTPGTATNSGAIISNCIFSQFNWNAVEIAGPQTSNAIVANCVANACGLAPFDLDKGCHDCTVSDVIINRLLGNIDLVANPNTRTGVASIQGISPSTGYAYNNTVKNVVANLLKADLDAYENGCASAVIAYGQNNVIDGVTVYCNGVPVRGATKRFGLACVAFETASGNQIRNVLVNNASAGIVQTQSQNAAMTSLEPNVFENIKNIGTMTEEAVQIAAGASLGAFSRTIIRNADFTTDLSNPYFTSFTYSYAVLAAATGSSSHFVKIQSSVIDLSASASKWFFLDQISRFSLENVVLQDNGTLASTRFIHSEGSTVPQYLGVTGVTQNFGQDPLDFSTSLQYLDQTAGIGSQLGDTGLPLYGPTILFSSAQPSYPPAAFWSPNLRVERITKAAGSYLGWTNVGGAWKTYGTVSA
jgi:hypothetical protein